MGKKGKNQGKRGNSVARNPTSDITSVQIFRWAVTVTASGSIAQFTISNATTAPDRLVLMLNSYRFMKPISWTVWCTAVNSANGVAAMEIIPGAATTAPAALTNFESPNMTAFFVSNTGTLTDALVMLKHQMLPKVHCNQNELRPITNQWLDTTGVGSVNEEQVGTLYAFHPTSATGTISFFMEYRAVFREPLEQSTAALLLKSINTVPIEELKQIIDKSKDCLKDKKRVLLLTPA